MDRRGFFKRAGVVGITAAVAGQTPENVASSFFSTAVTTDAPNDDGVKCLPDESGVMRGAPPPKDMQVTRENREESQARLRWAMQHWRELFPTQRVARSPSPIVLPRASRDIRALAFSDSTGEATTVARQLDRLHVNAFIVLNRGKIAFEEYRHGMRPETPHATFSLYKSIVATVITALTDAEERMEEDKTIESYVPELVGTAFEAATVRQLLDMESGIKFEYVGPNNEMSRHIRSIGPDARALGEPVGNLSFLFTLKKERNHGERMKYKEADPLALAWAAEKRTHKRFADLLAKRIWVRMGAEFDADVVCDSLCQWTFYLSATLRDLARWGLMCLNDGMVKRRAGNLRQILQRYSRERERGETPGDAIAWEAFS